MSLTQDEYRKLGKILTDQKSRLNTLYKITDKTGQVIPFQFNRAQEELWRQRHSLEIVLKSRQQGVTSFYCVRALDTCLFNPNIKAGIIAHNREDAKAFFREKVRFAYDSLPTELRESIPVEVDQAGELRFANGSSIRVGTSLRSATLQMLHISEFGKICAKYPDKAREIVTGSFNAVQAGQNISVESTAEGNTGYFQEYCKQAEDHALAGKPYTVLDWRIIFLPWWSDPDCQLLDAPADMAIPQPLEEYFNKLKQRGATTARALKEQDDWVISPDVLTTDLKYSQKAWYVKKWSLTGEDMKREYPSTPEEAFAAAIRGSFYSHQFNKIHEEGRICRVPYQTGAAVSTYWDLGKGDPTAIWFVQDVGREIHVIDYYKNSGEDLPHYVKVLKDKEYIYGRHVLPHDAAHERLGMPKSIGDQLKDLGLATEIAPRQPIDHGIQQVRSILPICWFDEANTYDGVKALEGYRKEWDDRGACYKNYPFKDWTNHGADAFRTLAMMHKFQEGGRFLSPRKQGSNRQTRANSVRRLGNRGARRRAA